MKVLIKIDTSKINQAKKALIEQELSRQEWIREMPSEPTPYKIEYKWLAPDTLETDENSDQEIRSILEEQEIEYCYTSHSFKDNAGFLNLVRQLTAREQAAISLGFPGSGNVELDQMIREANVKKNFEKLATEDMRKAADPERWMACLEASQAIEDFYHDMTLAQKDNSDELPY
jgi:hypothetical protein